MNSYKLKHLISFFLSLILATCMASSLAMNGFHYKSDDGRLEVWVPTKPRVSEQDFPSRTGSPYKQCLIASEFQSSVFIAGILDFRGDLATTGEEGSFLDTMMGSLQKGFGNRFTPDKNEASVDLVAPTGEKGRQIKGTVEGLRFIVRAFVGKHSIYTVQVTYPTNDKLGEKNAQRYLDSLQIDDHPKP